MAKAKFKMGDKVRYILNDEVGTIDGVWHRNVKGDELGSPMYKVDFMTDTLLVSEDRRLLRKVYAKNNGVGNEV